MRYKEEQIGMLKAQVDSLSAKVAKMEDVEEREKDIERVLKQTHSEMVYLNLCILYNVHQVLLLQTLLHQNCQSLLNENISLRTATSSSSSSENKFTVNNSPELKEIVPDISQ